MGKNVNIAWNGNLNPPLGDVEYLAAFRCCVMPIAKSFDPQIILVSCGFDGTENHPRELGGYKISPACKPRPSSSHQVCEYKLKFQILS